MRFFSLGMGLMLCANAVVAGDVSNDQASDMAELEKVITGSFTSEPHMAIDPTKHRVEAEFTRMWPARTDGLWIYQEQASWPAGKDAPYMQRVLHLYPIEGGLYRRDYYLLPDASAYVGAWADAARFDSLSIEALTLRDCFSTYERVAHEVWIATTERCPNTFRGSVTMDSLTVYYGDKFTNRDRGFDADGAIVWGVTGGGYLFERMR